MTSTPAAPQHPVYAPLDAAILARLTLGPKGFTVLAESPAVKAACGDLVQAGKIAAKEPWRAVDRRLQALRKAGFVRLATKRREGWELAPAAKGEA